MTDQFIGEIRVLPFTFAPKGWALCNGQLLPINQNQALFSLLGTNYGGNGTTNFALPNLIGRAPLHANGSSHFLGESAGATTHTLTTGEMPQHSHLVNATSLPGTAASPANAVPAAHLGGYADTGTATLNQQAVGGGGGQPHENMPPYLVLNFCIALQGIFPSQN